MELATTIVVTPHERYGEVVVVPIGDLQYTGESGSTVLRLLKDTIARGLDRDAYFLGMGDYIDFASPSNRARLKTADLYDTAKKFIDESVRALNLELYQKVLAPTKGRWLGLLRGHHFHTYETGISTDNELCGWLEAPFLGTCGYVRILAMHKRSRLVSFTIWCHHGAGGGQSTGSPLLKLERQANHWDADLFLIGHQSKLVSAPIERIYPIWDGPIPHLAHRKIMLACTGSFSRGYMVGTKQGAEPAGDYVEQKMLTPTALGAITVRFSWQRSEAKGLPNGRRTTTKKDLNIET